MSEMEAREEAATSKQVDPAQEQPAEKDPGPLDGIEPTDWHAMVMKLTEDRGVPKEQVADAWKDWPEGPGKHRSIMSRLNHGRPKSPPTPTQLFYMAREGWILRLYCKEMITLAQACHGAERLPEILEVWDALDKGERLQNFLRPIGYSPIREIADKMARTSPTDEVYSRHLVDVFAELSKHPEYWNLLAKAFRRGDFSTGQPPTQ